MNSLKLTHIKICILALTAILILTPAIHGQEKSTTEVDTLIAALLAQSPIINDLQELAMKR